jgi:hypothetical protein
MEQTPLGPELSPIDGAPTWIRALQAAVIGVVAGLALNALLSMVTVSGESLADQQPKPQQKQCKKSSPAKKDTAAPQRNRPAMSEVTWSIDRFVVMATPAATSVPLHNNGLDPAAGFVEWREVIPAD